MKCFYHVNEDAVGQCVDCGKFLCRECASKYKPVLCDDCYNNRIEMQNREKEEQERYNQQLKQQEISSTLENARQVVKIYDKAKIWGIIIGLLITFAFAFENQIGPVLFGGERMAPQLFLIMLAVDFAIFAFIFGIVFYLFSRNIIDYLQDKITERGFIFWGFSGIARYFKWKKLYKECKQFITENGQK